MPNSIYSEFIFDDYIISPINGHKCKKINSQNIKKFGFNSIDDLNSQYPNFPKVCNVLRNVCSLNALKTNQIQKKSKVVYNLNPNKCKNCKIPLTYEKKGNKFCNNSCSANFNNKLRGPVSTDTKQKRSQQRQKSNPPFCKIYYLICDNCSNPFISRKSSTKFCSHKCNGHVSGKKSATKRCKRSKEEIQLYELCNNYFKTNVLHNHIIVDGWDADIVLLDYKIAILWNGPWHYKDMNMSNHSLDQVVTRDCIKLDLFQNLGWKVLIYESRYWNPITAFIDIISNIKFGCRSQCSHLDY